MRYIDKDSSKVPPEFVTEVNAAHLDEDSLAAGHHSGLDARALFGRVKQLSHYGDFKLTLLEEQGYICCYCGCRIDSIDGNFAVAEHLLPISGVGRNKLASYDNLLISCNGDQQWTAENTPYGSDRLHCDAQKKNQILTITPLMPNCDKQFLYTIDGHVKGLNPDASDAVTKLNLDCVLLRQRRTAALDGILHDIDTLSDADLNLIKNKYDSKGADGKYEPYCTAVVRCIEEYLTN